MAQVIPPIFHSFQSQEPFKRCIECERKLDDDCEYIIEKAIKVYPGFSATDVIFDYAICLNCALNIRNSFSLESRQRIDEYFQENLQRLKSTKKDFQRCLLTGLPINELSEYQIYAHCRGAFLSDQIEPYMISAQAQEEMMKLVSSKTNEILDGFFDKHFSPDPEIMNPRPRPIMI